ncbi:hypothetical protein EKO04_003950 [Ascochyta lentis]|uniref:Uncharacterized protein n=1 Tax=Ascochyta lentis TaxID=205686 RepID=A0A8H7MKI0_9PLEO|nr:hypothetical protein EKO04_003950 [Ascochyta lentis]
MTKGVLGAVTCSFFGITPPRIITTAPIVSCSAVCVPRAAHPPRPGSVAHSCPPLDDAVDTRLRQGRQAQDESHPRRRAGQDAANPVNLAQQPEFTETASAPAANTAPTTSTTRPRPRPRPASANATVNKASEQAQGTEEGLAGPKSPAANTDPTTESPAAQPQESQEPQKPLPDLRFSIPSTFAAKHEAKGNAKRDPNDPNASEGPEPAFSSASGRKLPKSAYKTSTDWRRNRLANWGYLALLLFSPVSAAYIGRLWETEEEKKAHLDIANS